MGRLDLAGPVAAPCRRAGPAGVRDDGAHDDEPICRAGYVRAERAHLADLFGDLGPDQPTLCEGWTTRDLAAHLVVRERRPDSLPGVAVPVLAAWTERVRSAQAARDYAATVAALRAGPPPWSPFALPGASKANLTEFFVHHEDVRRGRDWAPRDDLDPGYSAALWQALTRSARLLWRRSGVGVELVVPDGRRLVARSGDGVVLTGAPGELLLHGFGRGAAARVDVGGPAAAVRGYAGVRLGI